MKYFFNLIYCAVYRKHLEYESKLIESVLHIPRNLQNISNDQANQIIINQIHNGLPSALLSHSSNQQLLQQQNPSASSSSTITNSTNTNSSTTNSTSHHTYKNDSKSRSDKIANLKWHIFLYLFNFLKQHKT